ncbi:MAG TPA: AI-2E family transporter, partial [Gemmataceae bacterium]|nr:AI-2E family transporter [Gemmataceae bacterium]
MPKSASPLGPYRPLVMLAGLVLVIATLYWAQKILIPLVLAVLLTFILSPLVTLLQRRGVPRIVAALLVVLLAMLVLGGIGTGLALQVKRLAGQLPQYKDNIARKVAGVRGLGSGGWLQNIRNTYHEIAGGDEPQEQAGTTPAPRPSPATTGLSEFGTMIGPVAELVATAGLVVVLVIFMLIQREVLRNRLMQLVPHGRLLVTTRALTEAAERLSRFLLMQVAVNAGYGVVVGLGLYLIGVPYALVWGILVAFLRYFPFVGTWLAMGLIVLFSVAAIPGWTQPLLVLGLLLAVELAVANAVEPVLFGHSTGVSPLALLVAVAFWTWLWGIVGLVLSTPVTVCLLVLGRHIPNLEFLGVVLGDEPALDPEINFYQRLLARDQDEATVLVEQYVHTQPPETVYDRVLIPALGLTKGDRERDDLTAGAEQFIYRAIRDILDDLAGAPPPEIPVTLEAPQAEAAPLPAAETLVLGCPARDEADALTFQMLGQMLPAAACRFEVVPAAMLTGEVAARVRQERP